MKVKNTALNKVLLIGALSLLTILFHYLYGMSGSAVLEAFHRRLCYIPIVLGGLWFGVYGGLATAAGISAAVVPFIYLHRSMGHDFVSGELVELLFYLVIGALTGVLSDAQKRQRKRNDELQEQLRASERLSTIGELFAYLMHEIKNPLGAIQGAADIVADTSVDPRRKLEFAGLLKSEINRLSRTLNSMLSYTRMKLNPGACTITAEINRLLQLLRPQAEKNNVRINLFFQEAPDIQADCDKLRQVFINLILNAIEAMPAGGKLDIAVRRKDSATVEIVFQDTGPGIRPEHINSLGKPLFTTKPAGTGLGLAISKRIVEEHKGKLLIESKPGEGTVCTVRLPCNV
jgi:signal transduction histidine kinase